MAQKYYVVWSGRKTGIFTSWAACKEQVNGFKGAKFKSYATKEEAEQAFSLGPDQEQKSIPLQPSITASEKQAANYIEESISVDAACSGNPGVLEYQGVYTKDGRQLFHYGPILKGTNNIGEFLAIVHALAYLRKKKSNLPIYSDSKIAINWVRKQRANTSLVKDESTVEVWELIERAEKWLQNNDYENKLLKWETDLWGESKADFGRK